MTRDREAEFSKQVRDAKVENKYHLVKNYNNDLIRRSLKSQNNQNRLNIKEHKAHLHFDSITKKIEEMNKKKISQLINRSGHNQMRSLGVQKRNDDLEADLNNQSESLEKVGAKVEKVFNYSQNVNTVSSNTTSHNNMSFSTNKSNKTYSKQENNLDKAIPKENPNKLLIKNSLIQRLKKRSPSKASNPSNKNSFSKEGFKSKNPKPAKPETKEDMRICHQGDDKILHLTLTGAKNNTNLVQINNYINKLNREDLETIADSRSHRQSAHSNSSNIYSNKSKATKKAEGPTANDLDMRLYASKLRKETANPLKPQNKFHYAQPILANLQNKNVLTLAQNLLQKRTRND